MRKYTIIVYIFAEIQKCAGEQEGFYSEQNGKVFKYVLAEVCWQEETEEG